MGRRRRLRDLFAGRATSLDASARPSSYEVDDLINLALDGDEPDVEGVVRVCGRHHARLWNKVENVFLREKKRR